MADEFELMKELAAAAEPCFDTADRLAVYCEMNLGALQHAVDDLISAVVRNDHPMPAGLIDASAHALAFELARSVKYRRLDCTLENRSRTKRKRICSGWLGIALANAAVGLAGDSDRRTRRVVLTTMGRSKFAQARRAWNLAQDRFNDVFGESAAAKLRATLLRIARDERLATLTD